MTKQQTVLKLALEALEYIHEGANNQGPHTGISWRCVSKKAEPAITAIREALAEQPAPPPECQTEAEKTAFAFGWWKALEMHRKPAQKRPQNCGTGYCSCIECVMETEQDAAIKTLQHLGYTYHGGEQWKPPLGQPTQQEPVAKWMGDCIEWTENPYKFRKGTPLYTSPQPSKPWVELTDEEIDLFINGRGDEDDKDYVEPTGDGFGLTDADLVQLVRRAEAKLREKNTGEQP